MAPRTGALLLYRNDRTTGSARQDNAMAMLQASEEFQALVNAALPSVVREVATSESGKLYRSIMACVELPLLRQALEMSGGNQLKAARLLGINRNTLRKRLRLLGLLRMPDANGSAPA